LNVLHLYKSVPPEDFGGVGVVIQNIARFTSARGARHRVLVCTKSSDFRVVTWPCGTEVFFCPQQASIASMPISFGYYRQFRLLLEWADVLHFHHPFPLQDLLYLSQKYRRPMPPAVVTYHSDVVRQRLFNTLYSHLARRFLNSVEVVIATSPNYVHSSHLLQSLQQPVDVIPLGIDRQAYPSVCPQTLARFEGKLGRNFLLFLGALRYYKGLSYLVQAAKATGLPVVIAGGGSLEAQLRSEAADAPNIHFVPTVSEVEKIALLALAQVFVFPSHVRSEAFGISLLEAQMMRLPLITCEIETGTSYVNEVSVTGLVVPPANASALADAMCHLYENPSLCREMGLAGHARFLDLFTAEKMSSRYLELYQSLYRTRTE
jgi:rhamnosyl/mannosyltransferase